MLTAAEIQMIRNADPGAVLPEIDTMTGNPYATSSLLDVTKITQNNKAPYYYNPATNTVYVTQAGAVLNGINFGDATVYIQANNVTIENSTFAGTTGDWAVRQTPNYTGATVQNCTFVGSKSPAEFAVWISSSQPISVLNNTFLYSPTDAVDIQSGDVSGNYFSGAAYLPGAHADAIYVTNSTGPTVITNNLIDSTSSPDDALLPNSTIRLTNELGNLANVSVSGNFLLGGVYTVEAGGSSATSYTVSNISFTNNYLGFGQYGAFYPSLQYVTVSGTTMVDFTNPTDANNAYAAYLAAGLPTANVVSATGQGTIVATGSAPTTLLGNGIVGAHLNGGPGETNFVGGFGSQYLTGGTGVNIFTYLSMSDGGDSIGYFDPAKDVIDLSHIDADITTPGVQNFTFIGTAPFSGGAQVRYQLNPTNDTTTVQAALAGDTTADFSLTLQGLKPLTAANFALTPAQSSADLAAGATVTESKVQTSAGAPSEYAYSSIQGQDFTSYGSFYGSTYGDLAADDLYLSTGANDLILFDPNLTITRGGGSESLQMGTGSDSLSYHNVETIDGTTSGNEQFIFGAGFGDETIKGFVASGATADSVQLSASSFSYLTAGMTQTQDLAAVLARAVNGSSGMTITDSQGDSLTFAGMSVATIAANSSAIQFA